MQGCHSNIKNFNEKLLISGFLLVVTKVWPIALFCHMKGKAKKKSVPDQIELPEDLLKLAMRIQSLRVAKGYSSYEYFA